MIVYAGSSGELQLEVIYTIIGSSGKLVNIFLNMETVRQVADPVIESCGDSYKRINR